MVPPPPPLDVGGVGVGAVTTILEAFVEVFAALSMSVRMTL